MSKDNRILSIFKSVTAIRAQSGLITESQLLTALTNSAWNENIKVFNSPFGTPIAYVAWASVNKESFQWMSKTRQMPPFPYEWNEGKLVIIYDIVFSPLWGKAARKELLRFLSEKRFIAYLKRGRLHVWTRGRQRPRRQIL